MALGVHVLAGLPGRVVGQRLSSLGQDALPGLLVAAESCVQSLSHCIACPHTESQFQACHTSNRTQRELCRMRAAVLPAVSHDFHVRSCVRWKCALHQR